MVTEGRGGERERERIKNKYRGMCHWFTQLHYVQFPDNTPGMPIIISHAIISEK
jgi:hypothetical protein